ncbi:MULTISPECIES: DUF4142 domain-containing protein [unclassified Saccharibacter]|uniref:DUF4142 domain-containing protein n=1 Tax=unclassified Saccharibacter TaxID=2648722 RepID=UPI00132845C5|nr:MULTISPECIES: DUF4142 domain-containing protein [unclassified Saccharibacter]MXV35526.1 DUF4142 domain-containing protein [Saccharibacter sp. EH611]MXV58186.1 DUF4142 domain-containing protein [Saccharibacter sp. EH70]MXV65459.1 DUF4142 domain-containing protein [Saccharibacter sp. EH60]
MTKLAKFSVLGGVMLTLGLGGCDTLLAPDAPPAPPLPKGPVSPAVTPVSSEDFPAIQVMNEHALFVQTLVALVPTHSERDLVKKFSSQLSDSYKKHQDAIMKLIQPLHIKLPSSLSVKDQQSVDHLSHLYGRSFDRAFLQILSHYFSVNDHKKIEILQKKGSTADVKTLAGSALQIEQDMQRKARDLVRY